MGFTNILSHNKQLKSPSKLNDHTSAGGKVGNREVWWRQQCGHRGGVRDVGVDVEGGEGVSASRRGGPWVAHVLKAW